MPSTGVAVPSVLCKKSQLPPPADGGRSSILRFDDFANSRFSDLADGRLKNAAPEF